MQNSYFSPSNPLLAGTGFTLCMKPEFQNVTNILPRIIIVPSSLSQKNKKKKTRAQLFSVLPVRVNHRHPLEAIRRHPTTPIIKGRQLNTPHILTQFSIPQYMPQKFIRAIYFRIKYRLSQGRIMGTKCLPLLSVRDNISKVLIILRNRKLCA